MQQNYFFALEQVIDRQPLTVASATPLDKVISLMQEWGNSCNFSDAQTSDNDSTAYSNNSCVLIVENSQLRGIFTERDLVRLIAADTDTEKVTIEEVMTQDVVTITPANSQDIFTVVAMLRQHCIRHLPVVDEHNNLLGVVTAKNLRHKLQPIDLMKWRKVKEIMETEVIYAAPNESIRHLARLMTTHKISYVAIGESKFDPDSNSSYIKPIGIITERDIVQFQNLNLDLEQPAENLMSTPLFLIHPEDTLWSVKQQMQQRRVRRLLVGDSQERLVGIITQTSLLQIFEPTEMYGVIEVLQRQVCQLEVEKNQLLEDRQAELEHELQNKTKKIQATLRDHALAEIELRESQERYTLAVEGSSNGLWDWNILTNEVFYAPRFKEMIGYSGAEMPNTFDAWSSKLHPEEHDRVLAAVQDHLENRVPYDIEYRLKSKQGEYLWFQARGQAIWDQNGQAVRMAGSITNIGDRKRREEILKDIASGVTIPIGADFLSSLVEYLSKALQVDYAFVAEFTQPTAESIRTLAVYGKGQTIDNFTCELAKTPCRAVVNEGLCVYAEGVRELFPQVSLLEDIEAEGYAAMPIYNNSGQSVGLIAVVDSKPFTDISLIEEVLKIFATRATAELERQQAELALQDSNRILQAISSIQSQFLTDAEPGIIFDAMLDHLLELTQSEYGFIGEIFFAQDGTPLIEESCMKFRGRPYLKTHAITNIAWNEATRAFYAENAPKGMEFHNLQTLFGAVIVTGEPVIANSPSDDPRRGGLPDGHPPLNAFLGVPFYKNNQMTGMVGIANRQGGYDQDIVDYLRPLMDTCSRIIEVYKSDRQRHQVEEKNREQAALLDIANDAIMVRGLDNQLLFWNRGAERLYGWTQAEALERNADELLYRESLAKPTQTTSIVRNKGEWQGELNQITKAGNKIVVESRWTLVKDDEGNPQSYLVVNTDITEQKQLQEQFLRAQRLESLGTLAGGIAHDLNNILAPILGFSRLLPLKLPDVDEQTKGFFQIMETNARRGSALVQQILTFSRGLEGDRGIVQIRHLIAEIGQIIRETFPKTIELEIDTPRNLFTVNADVNQLHQVLMNLAVNARDAMSDGGKLTISAENFTVDADYARLHLDAKEGSYLLITVTDTGVGIPVEIIDRIFEPFFTTKKIGGGTGLGLSTAIGIVKSHDGFVEVVSYPQTNKGTQFQVFLPACDTEVSVIEENEVIPQGNGELVLVVDDETAILEVTKATLETYNYRVLTAGNGIEAIAVYAQNQQAIDLVIMDIMMPSMDGKTAILTLKQINPEIKIIAVSGLIDRQEIIDEVGENISAYLAKPYTNDDLLIQVHEIVSG